jgi:ABC-type multidrug transport system ATPase subunit
MSTHILADVERVADVIGIIDQGKMVTSARKDVLMEQYALPMFGIEVAREGLLDSIRQEGLVIDRFEAIRPSLEDIFQKLVGDKEKIL